jgi:hypothetical protein
MTKPTDVVHLYVFCANIRDSLQESCSRSSSSCFLLVKRSLNASGGVALSPSKSLVTNGQLALVSARYGVTIAAGIEAEVVAATTEVVVAAVRDGLIIDTHITKSNSSMTCLKDADLFNCVHRR